MDMKARLVDIVGAENVLADRETLAGYSSDSSLAKPGLPSYVVRPAGREEVQQLVRVCGEASMPVVPSSSGVHMYGCAIPSQGGIVMDLRRLNRILAIDKSNRVARIEPGVTWKHLQDELAREDLMAMIPLLPHPEKSALTSHLEREPQLIPKFEYSEPLLTTEAVLPKGDMFRTGAACVGPGIYEHPQPGGVLPYGPGLDFWRLFQGAQGTMGIVTWGTVKVEHRSSMNKAYFIPLEDLRAAIDLMYRIGAKMLGAELLLLNDVDLASILAEDWPQDYRRLRGTLAPWTVLGVLSAGLYRPEERLEYEQEELVGVCREMRSDRLIWALPGLPGVEKSIVGMLRSPWPASKPYWRHACRGGSADLFFLTKMERVPEFVDALLHVVGEYGYSTAEVGCYVQPLEYGRACHLEFNLFFDPDDDTEVETMRSTYAAAAGRMLALGAHFSRPYGMLADMVYGRATGYTTVLKKVKKALDPGNLLNPGKLCF